MLPPLLVRYEAMLHYGVVGAGGMGATHTRHLSRMEGLDLSLFDVDFDRARRVADQHGASVCESFDALCARSDVVSICLPSDLHVEYGAKAMFQGCGILMEKPIARTLEEARKLVEISEQTQVPFMSGQVVRFFPDFSKGREVVANGDIGVPAVARVRRGGGPPGRGDSNSWFLDHRRSGGILVDLAVHDFDWLRWCLGEVASVDACALSVRRPIGPDYALTILKFDSGAIAHVESTWMDPSGFRTTFEICGSNGMVEHDSAKAGNFRCKVPGSLTNESLLSGADDPFYKELCSFVNYARTGGASPVSAYEGFMALSIGLSALESARTGKRVIPARS